jgi:hypothetical protein
MPSSSTFDAQCYINRYPDLRLNKFIMYAVNGLFGFGNTTNDAFSSLIGVQQAAGVKTGLVTGWQSVYEMPKDAYKHFQERGKAEGRMGGCDLAGTVYENTFNGAAYIARYPDVKENAKYYIDPVSHYQNKGILQSRIPGYEILNEQSNPDGITTPGTTKFISNPYAAKAQADNEAQALHPEDNTIVTRQETTTDTTTTAAAPPLTSVSIGTMNPTIIAGIGLLIIILISKKKKNGKQKK